MRTCDIFLKLLTFVVSLRRKFKELSRKFNWPHIPYYTLLVLDVLYEVERSVLPSVHPTDLSICLSVCLSVCL